MVIRIPKLKAEHFFGMFLLLFWGKDILFSYVSAVLIRIPYVKYIANFVIPTLMLVCLLFSLPYLSKTILWKDLLFAFSVGIVFLLHILLYPENVETGSIAGQFFLNVFPLYLSVSDLSRQGI